MAGQGGKLATGWLELTVSTAGAQGSITRELVPAAGGAGKTAGLAAGGALAGAMSGVLAGAAVGTAVVGAFAGLYKVGGIFDEVSDTIRAGTGATGEALKGLEDDARRVATTVPTSFEQAGATVADLNTRLGLSGSTLQTVASQYLEAGRILGQDVDVQSTSAAFSAFRIEGDAVSGAMDTLFQVSQATGVGMNELASGVQTVAPSLQTLGFGFQESVSLMGVLDKAGLNATAVLGSMSKGMINLAKDGEEPQAAFQRVTGEIQGFVAAGDTAGALDLASKVFGTKGAAQFVGALQSGKLNLDDITASAGASSDTILGVGAATADAAESWTLIKNNALDAIEPIGTAVFGLAGNVLGSVAGLVQQVAPQVKTGLEVFLPMLSALGGEVGSTLGPIFASVGSVLGGIFTTLGPVFAPLIPQIFGLVSALSPVSLIFQAISPLLPQLTALFITLATSIGGALGPALSAIVTAITPVAAILTSGLMTVIQSLIPIVNQLVALLGGTLSTVLATIVPIIGQVAGVLGTVLSTAITALLPIIGMLVGFIAQLLPILAPLFTMIAPLLGAILGLIAPLLQLVGAILTPLITLLGAIIAPILAIVQVVISALIPIIESVIQVLTGVITFITGVFTGNWDQAWQGIQQIFAGIWNLIVSVVTGLFQIVISVITGGVAIIGAVWNAAWSAIGAFFASIWNAIVSFAVGAVQTVVGAVSGFVDTVRTRVGEVVQFFLDLPGKIIGAIAGIGADLFSSGQSMIQQFIDGIAGMVGAVGDAVSDVVGTVLDFLPHSPARRGPLSGAGWTSVGTAGAATVDAYAEGALRARGRVQDAMSAVLDPDVLGVQDLADDLMPVLPDVDRPAAVAARRAAAAPVAVGAGAASDGSQGGVMVEIRNRSGMHLDDLVEVVVVKNNTRRDQDAGRGEWL